MKLLLDSHILIWWLNDSPQLPNQARVLISSTDNTIFVSTVSLWEIWLKVSVGKLRLPTDFEARLASQNFITLPLQSEHARAVASLPWHHRDPFDRMLIAQAIASDLLLLTADRASSNYGPSILHVT